jgi:hypothetical protein
MWRSARGFQILVGSTIFSALEIYTLLCLADGTCMQPLHHSLLSTVMEARPTVKVIIAGFALFIFARFGLLCS